MDIKDLLRMKIKHLESLYINLQGFNPYRTEQTANNIKVTARMLSVDIADFLDYARSSQLISEESYFEKYKRISELRNKIDRFKV